MIIIADTADIILSIFTFLYLFARPKGYFSDRTKKQQDYIHALIPSIIMQHCSKLCLKKFVLLYFKCWKVKAGHIQIYWIMPYFTEYSKRQELPCFKYETLQKMP